MMPGTRLVAAPLLAASALLAAVLALAAPAQADNGPSGAETISVKIPPAGSVTCTAHGKALPPNSTVHRGDRLRCTASGFTAGETVSVAVHSPSRDVGRTTADASGTAHYGYTVPDDLAAGAHSLSFTGLRSTAVAIYPFVVAGASGSGGGGGSGGGSVAFTGANILGLVAIGLALIGSGLAVHRRRLEREHA